VVRGTTTTTPYPSSSSSSSSSSPDITVEVETVGEGKTFHILLVGDTITEVVIHTTTIERRGTTWKGRMMDADGWHKERRKVKTGAANQWWWWWWYQ